MKYSCTVITKNQRWLTISAEVSSYIFLTVLTCSLLLRGLSATSASCSWSFSLVYSDSVTLSSATYLDSIKAQK